METPCNIEDVMVEGIVIMGIAGVGAIVEPFASLSAIRSQIMLPHVGPTWVFESVRV